MAVIKPVIPENIVVHLGPPDRPARNVTVPFAEYVKNVASSEIYPTWPENALRANVYAIVSFALNRIYTEWYRSRGYNFDITSSTAYDQAFVENRDIFENIGQIVDEQFNNYVVRRGDVVPYFTQFCNGTTSKCNGLSQWGTVTLAERGYTPYEILKYYYGNNIELVMNAPVQNTFETYPGIALRLGDANNGVKIIQTELNRIAQNYPAIPKIANENGFFGTDTEAAVRAFQRIFSLDVDGVVGKATWYKIRRYYVGVKRLSELVTEGISLEEAGIPFATTLQLGQRGPEVGILQYYLNIIALYNPQLNTIQQDGIYGPATAGAVSNFQSFYGLPVTGNVDANTWRMLVKVYNETLASLPEGYSQNRAKIYPGFFLTLGMTGQAVRDLQTYLRYIGQNYNNLPVIAVTGVFDAATETAVRAFQAAFGLEPNGAVGPLSWNSIAEQYDFLVETQGAPT